MRRPKIMTVYGTRPEAIKVAPVIAALSTDERFESIAVSTGQHREMLDQVNQIFGIRPDIDLGIMKQGQPLNKILSRAVAGLDDIIATRMPDLVITQGDTSTTVAAALSAFYRGVKVAHLEAGLRTGNKFSPFPEEANRRIVTQVASVHLTPTIQTYENLVQEGVNPADIVVTGNTVIDALQKTAVLKTKFTQPEIARAATGNRKFVLITTHRRENIESLTDVATAINRLAYLHPTITFVLPLHLNPAVREIFNKVLETKDNVIVTDPLPYDEFTTLMSSSLIIITDSGGIQEEALGLGVPVLVLRENTERMEAVATGAVKLIGTSPQRIITEVDLLLKDAGRYDLMVKVKNPYGDGKAAERVVAAIAEATGVGLRMPDYIA